MRIIILLIAMIITTSYSHIRNQPYALITPNLEYVLEMTPPSDLYPEGLGVIYRLDHLQKGDSLWSFEWYFPSEMVTFSNDGNVVYGIGHYGFSQLRASFRDGEEWVYDLPRLRRSVIRSEMCMCGYYSSFIRDTDVQTGFSDDLKEYTFVLADKRGFIIDLKDGEIIDSFRDSTGLNSSELRLVEYQEDSIQYENYLDSMFENSLQLEEISETYEIKYLGYSSMNLTRIMNDSTIINLEVDIRNSVDSGNFITPIHFDSINNLVSRFYNANYPEEFQIAKMKIKVPFENRHVYVVNNIRNSLIASGIESSHYNKWICYEIRDTDNIEYTNLYDPISGLFFFEPYENYNQEYLSFSFDGTTQTIMHNSEDTLTSANCDTLSRPRPLDEEYQWIRSVYIQKSTSEVANESLLLRLLETPTSEIQYCDGITVRNYSDLYITRMIMQGGYYSFEKDIMH